MVCVGNGSVMLQRMKGADVMLVEYVADAETHMAWYVFPPELEAGLATRNVSDGYIYGLGRCAAVHKLRRRQPVFTTPLKTSTVASFALTQKHFLRPVLQ